MDADVREFVGTCPACQISKSTTRKTPGLLHPLSIPVTKFAAIGINFVGPLPESRGFDYLIVITDRLTGWVALIPSVTTITSLAFAQLYYDNWVSKFGLPTSIISDRDKLFTAGVWKRLNELLGTKLKMSTAYHPQTDGISERSDKTVTQALRAWTDDQGRNWSDHLQRVAFAMNNTVRRSTNFTPSELVFGKRSTLAPPILAHANLPAADVFHPTKEEWEIAARRMDLEEGEAKDRLLISKYQQAVQVNRHRRPEPTYAETARRHASKLKPYQESDSYHQNIAPRILERPPASDPPHIIQ
ncbi:hypothetical protein B9479_008335, partial [Cryptococcus floricola]